jgi:hypothetical protein
MNKKMKIGTILLCLLLCSFVLFIACHKQEQEAAPDNTVTELDNANEKWMSIFNKKSGDVVDFYLKNAVLITENGDCYRGNLEIASFYQKYFNDIAVIQSVIKHGRFPDQVNIYEMWSFVTQKNDEYEVVTSWAMDGKVWRKELEIIAKKESSEPAPAALLSKEKLFTDIVNKEHNVKKLLEKLYLKDAYYYNRGKLYQGQKEIAQAYSYMGQSGYPLRLTTDHVVMVKQNLAFEVGTWFAGETGKYILIWKKQPHNDWKIILDSNY